MLARVLDTAAVGVAVVLGVIGVVAAPAQVLVGLGVGLVVGAVVDAAMVLRVSPVDGIRASVAPHASGLAAGAVATGGWLVVTGLTALLGPVSGVVTLLLAAVSMICWRVRRRRMPATVLETLSTRQLCSVWRHSDAALLDLPDGPTRREIVRIRGRLLNELERRDPAGFARWLHKDRGADSDPSHYLTTDQ